VFLTAVDASKPFDRVNHMALFRKLRERKLPYCVISVIQNWYSKLYSVVRWNSVFSSSFRVTCGVRQGWILSPVLFNLYVDDLIVLLRNSAHGCYVNTTFVL